MTNRGDSSLIRRGGHSLVIVLIVSILIINHNSQHYTNALLFPVETESRQLIQLGNLWLFKISPESDPEQGFTQQWFNSSLKKFDDDYYEMPVPSSFNDVGINATIRDFIGWAWYQRSFFAPRSWSRDHNRVFLRFGSVHYLSKVWLNGKLLGEHKGGHLPFEFEITDFIQIKCSNFLTVAVNNELTSTSLPQGFTRYPNSSLYPDGYKIYSHNCDYFDFSGINRPVYLYTTPRTYVKDIDYNTIIEDQTTGPTGILNYDITTSDIQNNCTVQLYDKSNVVAESKLCRGSLTVNNVKLWWPISSQHSHDVAFMYSLEIQIGPKFNPDIFRQSIGFRNISWDEHGIKLNGEDLYIHGFGMHEDSNIRGRGFDYTVLMKDINLMKWIGANAIRTSHYPYAEETIMTAEKYGLMIIVETPGCSIGPFGDELLEEHKRILEKMIAAHKKRANVIMWSIANEPSNTTSAIAVNYFKELAEYTKVLDPSRPTILITGEFAHTNASQSAFQYVDVIGVNRYAAWYRDSGKLNIIQKQVELEMVMWYQTFNKPVLITEYGAGSVTGQHVGPATMWSEDYQTEYHKQYFQAFDNILAIEDKFFLGEMIWNFIDFKTPQEYIRPGLCVKGIFTRDRQPKAAAYYVRQRYCKLANLTCNDNYLIGA